ncbi:hypothetical protein DV736_g1343, partial [Chaetothyriales sp. CBS 134916]
MDDHNGTIDSVIGMVTSMKVLHHTLDSRGTVNELELSNALRDLPNKGGTIPLHIKAQNAGIMVSKVGSFIHVEAFELCPLNKQVLTTRGRLRRSFPGPALALTIDAFEKPHFQATMAHTLAKMSHQPAVETQPKAKKAGRMHDESRDTTHPKMVTELFIEFLSPIGKPVDVLRLRKNTREEVMWLNALLPWRRSPVWLLLRVAMQLVFSRLAGSGNLSADSYKTFMVFLMGKILKLSLQYEIPSDLLYVMNAKLGRRLLKLDPSAPKAGITLVQSVMQKAAEIIRARWETVTRQASPRRNLTILESLDFERDAFAPLERLSNFVNSLSTGANWTATDTFQPASILVKYQASTLPTFPLSSEEYVVYNLKAFEAWVASHLPQWLEHHKGNAGTCGELSALIVTYYRTASPRYSGNPESFSLLLLTIIELWIACDQSALHLCKFLKDYDPGVPPEVARSLILPFKCQMQRLLRAEDYLKRRRGVAHHLSPSIFRDYGQSNCFAVRYFNQSPEHQRIRQDIESHATQTRNAKVNELHKKKERYRSFMRLYDQSICDYDEVVVDYENDVTERRHSGRCQRCRYKSEANDIDIQVHEWPLPHNDLEAKSTVFELKVPSFFGQWRDIALFLLQEILKAECPSACKPRAIHPLRTYTGLSSFFRSTSGQRLSLLSEIKPHGVTHRRSKSIAATTESDVCLQNGLRYRYFDDTTGTFIYDFHVKDEILTSLTYELPKFSSPLQRFLLRSCTTPSGPSPNTVIASQSDCPEHMSLEEFKALCTIPLGHRNQWPNILVQLSAPSVDFRKVETTLVILQSIYQAGPSLDGNILRAGHEVLSDHNFAIVLLKSLDESLQRVRENWESSQAVSTFISVSSRLLSLTAAEDIKTQCLDYLRETRAVTFGWVNLLTDKAYGATNDAQRIELLAHAVELALICTDTFNVDDKYLDRIFTSHQDGCLFIQCCILIQNSTLAHRATSNPMTPILHQRWKSLCYRSYNILANKIVNVDSRSLDHAIRKTWSSYMAGDGWRAVSNEFDHWLFKYLSPKSSEKPLVVHYNLLTGELLVGGLPLAHLPRKYTEHSMYRTLFGQSNLEVMPTTVKGMQFSGKRDHAGYTIHLGIRPISNIINLTGSDLLVRAVKDGLTYDLVPSRVLDGDFPAYFTEEFVHWYNAKDDCVEFRSVEDPWNSSTDNWKLIRDPGDDQWRLARDGLSLISVKSETAKVISGIFSPLESLSRLHVILQSSSSTLEIELPRLSLAFLLKSGTSLLRSKQFRGLAVDPDQSLGTLVGLQSKLMLQNDATGRRSVIIPEGSVFCRRDGDHVHVTIGQDSAVKAHTYPVDRRLGRLLDNGTLQSKLWICYLHALTSFCLPDPLILRTGTEQALFILRSAAVRSFDRLAQENIHVLHQIARLTAGRSYYPANERVMQTVKWAPELSFLAQHGGFYKSVKLIFAQAKTTRVFYPGSYIRPLTLEHIESDLLDRDCIRSSTFRVSGFGAEDHTIKYDATYSARDQGQNSPQALKAFAMSNFVFHEHPTLSYRVPPKWSRRLWCFLAQKSPILGPNHPMASSDLNYDAGLLQDWTGIISRRWCVFHRTFSNAKSGFDKFRLMIWLSTLAFAKDSDIEIIQALGSFFVLSRMAQISPPAIASFQLSEGAVFQKQKLRSALRTTLRPFTKCPESKLARNAGESDHALKSRRQRQFQSNQDRSLTQLIQALENLWPCEFPILPNVTQFHTYMNMENVMQVTRPKFKTWYDNYRLNAYLGDIEDVLQGVTVTAAEMPSLCLGSPGLFIARGRGFISNDDIFSGSPPSILSSTPELLTGDLLVPTSASNDPPQLASLLNDVESLARSRFEMRYVEDLQVSLRSFQSWDKQYRLASKKESIKKSLYNHLSRCKDHVQKIQTTILDATAYVTGDMSFGQRHKLKHLAVMVTIKQWPRLCPIFFLEQLSRHRWPQVTQNWRLYVVRYALALTELQRAERLISLLGSQVDLIKELRNPGHTNWDPEAHPESLLLEVESGFLIRRVQEEIARQMRDVVGNATMQLNMGEGKSSVIVPGVAAALANGSRLVRIVTAKAQAKQMFQMLVSKLGGLLGRRVCHMPFSRSLRLEEADAIMIGDMCREVMTNGDILLVQPEHVLSFKLMGLECLITGRDTIGRSLLRTQDFFDTSSRDVVDESDENFSVKFELIYTMGMQRPVELSPRRWMCIQQVLDFVKKLAPEAEVEVPSSMEVHEGPPGSFPRTRVLDSDGQRWLCNSIAIHICDVGLYGFPLARQPNRIREAVFRYLTEPSLSPDEISRVESQEPGGFWTDTTSQTLLLLRGLLAGGILSFAFGQKRWRVQYGLDTSRRPPTKLAVPYRAKDSPTLRSEFSHPDVVIVLTCLSHYYGGMKNDDLFLALDCLLKSDQADAEYQEWVKDAPKLPPAFRQLSGINLKDRLQCIQQVFPPLRFAKNAIDYFLTHLVFPKEMREFPQKLSASGWDIGQTKTLPTSGFSGTNDSRMTLPLSVTHLDLEEQKHTNALVLEYLLRPENSVMLMPAIAEASISTAESLLDMVTKMDPPAQVILDVGAQIIELGNVEVAREWLKRTQDNERAQAVVFFNEDDELFVLDRKGRIERLQTSPFANQLEVCLVFLDEAHTRGTDLKLPEYYKAAVTLGASLTKDRLIQACMRMRKLGHGQSVVFCVPEEINRKLLSRRKTSEHTAVGVSDVLSWAITETWADIRRSMPLWALQGRRFEFQRGLWADARIDGKLHMTGSHAERFLEDESQSLESRYRPCGTTNITVSAQADQNTNLQDIVKRCSEFDSLEHSTASLQEEQERELSPEIVQECEVQRAAPAKPAKHCIHPSLTAFVIDGILPRGSEAFKPAFETLRQTSAAAYIDVSQFPPDIVVTVDFATTVQSSGRSPLLDAYQRPVQWILTSIGNGSGNVVKHLVIISPHEAEILQTTVRRSKKVTLHLYAPRPNLASKAKYVPSSGTYPSGFYVSGVHVGVKASNSTKPDLAFITSDRPAHAAAVFTTNKFQAAPVQVSRSVLERRKGEGVRSIIINSGCANAVTGEGGLQDAEAMARAATECFDNSPLNKTATAQSLVMSTGVIGQRLPIDKILSGIPRAHAELGGSHESWLRAARAIMTTDTFPKLVSTTFTLPSTKGTEYRLAGITKGAGMIHPNMATLLGIIATDAPITAPALHSLLTTANARSFNSISIDGDTSTNDTVAILANGAGSPKNTQYITSIASPDYAAMSELLTSFAQRLAHLVVRDGEGATKFVEIRVRNAASNAAAQLVAASIARSPLVKTAIYGRDANWGRILCAIGYTQGLEGEEKEVVVPARTSVSFIPSNNSATKHEGVLRLLVNGEPQAVDEARATRLLEDEDLIVDVDLGTGVERGQYWTCDFSHEYVTINGDYRT